MAGSTITVNDSDLIELGEIKAAYGIKGWIKVYSYSRPVEQIFSYAHWLVGDTDHWQLIELEQGKVRSNGGLIAKLANCDDRNNATAYFGKKIAIRKNDLAALDSGEYYWSQLIGLTVINDHGLELGQITAMLETGANDVMVVNADEHERLIPYADAVVIKVDLEQQQILVAWDFEE